MTFLHPEYLFLLPAGLLLGLLYRLGLEKSWRRAPLGLRNPHLRQGVLRPVLWGTAAFSVILSLSGPSIGEKEAQPTRGESQTTVFLVDVSWSMLTPDIFPSRLESTKEALLRLVPDLDQDQAGLMVFSGTSVVRAPISADKGYLIQALKSVAAGQAARGGTLVGDALRKAGDLFGPGQGPLTLWLFTDGGDQESFPVEAARDLAARGHRLLIWGLGTEQGGRIPDRDADSRLNRTLLQSMAAATPGGGYWEGDPGNFPEVYRTSRQTRPAAFSPISDREGEGYWFMLAAFLLLCWEAVLSYPGVIIRRSPKIPVREEKEGL